MFIKPDHLIRGGALLMMIIWVYGAAVQDAIANCPEGWRVEEVGKYCSISIKELDNDPSTGMQICTEQMDGSVLFSGHIDISQKTDHETLDLLCRISIGVDFDLMLPDGYNVSDPVMFAAFIHKYDTKNVLP